MKNTKVKYSFAEWCMDNERHDWLDRWDYELNSVGPENVDCGTHKQYWFKCARGLHDSEKRIIRLIVCGETRPFCRKCNSIGQFLIDTYGYDALDKMWSNKNTLDPFLIAKNAKGVKVWLKCSKHNHPDSEFSLISVLRGSTCKVCSGHGVVIGYNDIATTHPEYIRYFLHTEDVYTVGRWSEKRIYVVCPDCGHVSLKRVCDLISYPFNCRRCGDKSSYPNKYMYEFLLQLSKIYGFDIYPEHVFEWSKKLAYSDVSRRIYDFYITYNDRKIIIEVHGGQHFDGSFDQYQGGRTLEDEIQNDVYKKSLAISNGISECDYIIIDARKSSSIWIKNSILNSSINNIFNFNASDIDWEKCDEFACKNLVKTASELWNSGVKSTSEIGKKIGRTVTTIIAYLKKAHDLGWCDYTPKYIKRYERKALLCIDNNIAFESAEICEKYGTKIFGVHMYAPSVQNAACGKTPTYRDKTFKYITKDELFKHQLQYPNLTFMDEYFINNNIINNFTEDKYYG